MLERIFIYLGQVLSSILSVLKIGIRSQWFPDKVGVDNRRCILLGNGPSIKKVLKEEQDWLKSNDLLCVNKFPDTEYFELLRPRHYMFCSPEYWADNTVDPNTPLRKQIIRSLIERAQWPINVFIPNGAKSNPAFIQKIQSNPHIQIVFFNTTPVEGLASINHWLLNRRLGSPRPHNVLIPALLHMINAGYKELYLLGADHSWIPLVSVNEDNIALVNQQHFYDENTVQKDQKMYHKGIRPRRLHEILEKFMLAFKSYFDLKAYAKSKQVEIYNCTPGSFIDAFPRKDLKTLIHQSDISEL
ncbi:MAG: hypothetical protein AAFP19_09725 [Bacteroidota bacterium]